MQKNQLETILKAFYNSHASFFVSIGPGYQKIHTSVTKDRYWLSE